MHRVNLAVGTNTRALEGKHHKKQVTPNREKKERELWVDNVLLLTRLEGEESKQTTVWDLQKSNITQIFTRTVMCLYWQIRMNCSITTGSKIFAGNYWGTCNQHTNLQLEGFSEGNVAPESLNSVFDKAESRQGPGCTVAALAQTAWGIPWSNLEQELLSQHLQFCKWCHIQLERTESHYNNFAERINPSFRLLLTRQFFLLQSARCFALR